MERNIYKELVEALGVRVSGKDLVFDADKQEAIKLLNEISEIRRAEENLKTFKIKVGKISNNVWIDFKSSFSNKENAVKFVNNLFTDLEVKYENDSRILLYSELLKTTVLIYDSRVEVTK